MSAHEIPCRRVEPDLFFSDDPADVATAKWLCGQCPIRELCLTRSLDALDEFGVFGGMTPQERKYLGELRAEEARQSVALASAA